ncbi:MAG TPA: GTPase Era [Rhodothermales bacterium]|nr:GTPase Era [Rhodothermales bacterium]
MGEEPVRREGEDEGRDFRSGYAALVGQPNVGKSTLMNALIGMKLSIVTRKAQTTRHRILGILSDDRQQIIFVDTPGNIEPRYGLQKAMMQSLQAAIRDADVVIHLIDGSRRKFDFDEALNFAQTPAVLAINKLDLMSMDRAMEISAAAIKVRAYEAVVPISAKKNKGLDKLIHEVSSLLPIGPEYYPREMVTEHPERFFVSEIIREKIFENYHEEVPYAVQVNVVAWAERKNDKDLIDAEIIVERESQKGIVIGRRGSALKRIGTAARSDIEAMIGREVFLRLFVKVRAGWRDSEGRLREFGYV